MTVTVLLDTHVLIWLTAAPERLSSPALQAIDEANDLAVAAITWFELAWLIAHDRIEPPVPGRAWMEELAQRVRTMTVTPAIADTAVSLPDSFPEDPADRLIYATALEYGWPLVTGDQRLRNHSRRSGVTVW